MEEEPVLVDDPCDDVTHWIGHMWIGTGESLAISLNVPNKTLSMEEAL